MPDLLAVLIGLPLALLVRNLMDRRRLAQLTWRNRLG